MFQAHLQSANLLIILTAWLAFFDGLFQPMHLIVIGIIAVLLLGKRLPDSAFWLGKKSVEFKHRKLLRSLREIDQEPRGEVRRDDEEPGACAARLDPPDKPRPPAEVALAPPKAHEE
jgi:Sec-independent protein translocase protein TatA